MKNNKPKSRSPKILRIILLTLAGLIIITGVTAYFLIHSYINKMNLIRTETTDTVKSTDNYIPGEETIAGFGQKHVSGGSDEVDAMGKAIVSSGINDGTEDDIGTNSTGGNPDINAGNEAGINSDLTANASGTGNADVSDITDGEAAHTDKEGNPDNQEDLQKLELSINQNIAKEYEITENPKVINILFLGAEKQKKEEISNYDNMVVISLNQETRKIIAISIMKDLYLRTAEGYNDRLTGVYQTGDAGLLLKTLEMNLKFKIDKFIQADTTMLIDIVDLVGGIELQVKKRELDSINEKIRELNEELGFAPDHELLQKSGKLLFSGKQLMGYLRSYDLSRQIKEQINVKKSIFEAIYDKAKHKNLFEINNLLNTILPKITTNLSENEILAQFFMLPTYFSYDIEDLTIPVSKTYNFVEVNGLSVLGIDFDKNITEINNKLYNVSSH